MLARAKVKANTSEVQLHELAPQGEEERERGRDGVLVSCRVCPRAGVELQTFATQEIYSSFVTCYFGFRSFLPLPV